jgi:hypothetical protein
MLSVTVCFSGDDARSRNSDIVRRSKNVDETDVDILETRIALVCCKQLAQFRFIVKGRLKDTIKRNISLWKISNAREELSSLFVLTRQTGALDFLRVDARARPRPHRRRR